MNRMPDRPPRVTRAASSPGVRIAVLAAAAWWAAPAAGAVAQDGVASDRAALEALLTGPIIDPFAAGNTARVSALLGDDRLR